MFPFLNNSKVVYDVSDNNPLNMIKKPCFYNDNLFEEFSVLDNDEARFLFMYNWEKSNENVHESKKFDLKENNKKNQTIALELKKKGNTEFQAKQWNAALELYNQSYHATPTENVEDISIILANRSAALYNMEMYDLAINDIELAMTNYPKKLMYKIEERKAKCLLAKNDLHKALQHSVNTLGCLEDSIMSDDTREKLKQDVQIQIQILFNKPPNKSNISNNLLIEKLHESVVFDYNENEGNFAVAKRDIKIGEQILVQKPHCAVLLEKYCKTNCHNCFQRTIAPLPCPSCSNVVFCGKDCREVALGSYHKYECAILPIILYHQSNFPDVHLSLRIISQHNLDYFLNLKDELKNGITIEDTLKLPSNDYRKVFSLVRHEKVRNTYELNILSSDCYLLMRCLKLSGYFPSDNDDEFCYIGGLILRNLQIIACNSMPIKRLQKTQIIPIGFGIYPTLALFNSCIPNIFYHFEGTTIVVNSIQTTKAGDMIAVYYVTNYSVQSIETGNTILNEIWRLNCNCRVCKEDWPVHHNLEIIRLKCAGKKPCNNVLEVRNDTNSFMIKCNSCGQITKTFNAVAAYVRITKLFPNADTYVNNGEYDKARSLYNEIVTILESFMVPPHFLYFLLQERIMLCLIMINSK